MSGRVNATAKGKRILIVEDEYFIAESLARDLHQAGAVIFGPVPTVSEALDLIAAGSLDGAVVDIKLRDEMAYPVADALIARGIPLVFATGYSATSLPARYAAVMCCEKPVGSDMLIAALFPS